MKSNSGFSLIELMIVVAIIGILAAVAVPSYQGFVQEGRRAEGVAFALDIASRQERFYTQASEYSNLALTDNTADGLNMPSITSENGQYTGTVAYISANNSTYQITVTPSVTDADCGNLTLDNTGVRGISISGATAAEISDCWR